MDIERKLLMVFNKIMDLSTSGQRVKSGVLVRRYPSDGNLMHAGIDVVNSE